MYRRLMQCLVRGAAAGAVSAGLLLGTPALAARTDIVLGIRLEPPHLDPTAGAAAAIAEVVYNNVFQGLTRIDRDGSVKPSLAERWDVSEDGKVYTFHLRQGVKFHDGTTFDAEDVKFSLDRARAADSVNPQKGLFEPIETVEVVDPQTVRITLKRPSGNLPFNLGWAAAVIVAPESAADNKTQPVGTGPFKLAEWVKGDHVTLVRNDDYWGEPVALEKATFKIIGDPTASFAALMAGDVDAFPLFPAPENVPQFEADPRFTVVVGNTQGKTVLAMNNGRKPFDDIRVRRAISHAVDRQALIEGAMHGYGKPIGSHFVPQDRGSVDLTGKYPFDPEKARALLKEAGAENLSVQLVLPPPDYARRGGEVLASQLRNVGISVEIVPMEWAQWLGEVFRNKNFDMTVVSHVEPLDLDIYARDDYYFGYRNPEYRALYERFVASTDENERLALLGTLQEKLADDAVNVWLFLLPKIGIWDARLEGLWENTPVPANDLTGVKWRE
jgi:peptide/nickel transport system substrate-binding protein